MKNKKCLMLLFLLVNTFKLVILNDMNKINNEELSNPSELNHKNSNKDEINAPSHLSKLKERIKSFLRIRPKSLDISCIINGKQTNSNKKKYEMKTPSKLSKLKNNQYNFLRKIPQKLPLKESTKCDNKQTNKDETNNNNKYKEVQNNLTSRNLVDSVEMIEYSNENPYEDELKKENENIDDYKYSTPKLSNNILLKNKPLIGLNDARLVKATLPNKDH